VGRRRFLGRPFVVLSLVVLLFGGSAGGCRRSPSGPRPSSSTSSTTTTAPESSAGDTAVESAAPAAGSRPGGGSVRVGVWAAPDPGSAGIGGEAVRALVLPQLFVARPDGRWSPSLVEPGSDRTADDGRSASFRLRAGAVWSDGTPIGSEDLRRTMDARFVSAVEAGPDGPSDVVVRFTQALPGWRRLWSASDSIAAPSPGVWGGPFIVSSVVAGLETVLTRNDRWWGVAAGRGPFLDEVRMVLVPDAVTARLLLTRGELDVVMPLAATVRRAQLERVAGISIDTVERGGWSVSLVANAEKLSVEKRRSLFASVDRAAFVGTLLSGEATLLDGFAGAEDGTWSSVRGPGDVGSLRGQNVDVVGFVEEPMTGLLHRSMQKRVRAAGGTLELRAAESDRVEGWLREGAFEAGVVVTLDPLGMCWRCRFGEVGPAGLVAAADAGDPVSVAAFSALLRDEARVLPLWRPTTVVAWRPATVSGVRANGFGASAAWNASEWWRPAGAGGA
jgi:hypothetical protein